LPAAAKLANVTRTQKPTAIDQSYSEHQQLQQHVQIQDNMASSNIHPNHTLLKYSASNGSVMDNFSTDECDEGSISRVECLNILPLSTTSHHLPYPTVDHHFGQG
jgi:hypothetical protein